MRPKNKLVETCPGKAKGPRYSGSACNGRYTIAYSRVIGESLSGYQVVADVHHGLRGGLCSRPLAPSFGSLDRAGHLTVRRNPSWKLLAGPTWLLENSLPVDGDLIGLPELPGCGG